MRTSRCGRRRRKTGESVAPTPGGPYQFDQTADGRVLKLLHVVDESTREALAIECRSWIDSDATAAVLEQLVAARGTVPEHVRADNCPELTANALRDWCRFSGAGSAYLEPGSPLQNPYVEVVRLCVRDELLAVEQFSCLAEAQVMVRLARGLERAPTALDPRHDGARQLRARVVGRPPAALALWARSASRRPRYAATTQRPPALTRGGPMNGVRPQSPAAPAPRAAQRRTTRRSRARPVKTARNG